VTIERIFLATKPGAAITEVHQARVVAGSGIEGDRYFDAKDAPGQNISLVEAEDIEAFNADFGAGHELSCTRRNVVTRGVRLSALLGKEFSVGSVRLRGVEFCDPCAGLGQALASESVSPAGVVKFFMNRAGIRADILSSGSLAVGDDVSVIG
jgi:MOSC domain-containing protein YiiM